MKAKLWLALMSLSFLSACRAGAVTAGPQEAATGTGSSLGQAVPAATMATQTWTVPEKPRPASSPTITPTEEANSVLPRDLYYMALDSGKKSQIFRLGKDGITITQITFEQQGGMTDFDISPVDGTIVYAHVYADANQLIAVNPDGGNRSVLAEGPTTYDEIGTAVWSPDGQTLAYVKGNDLYLYSLSDGQSSLLLAGSTSFSRIPRFYSPDGKKLVITRITTPGAPMDDATEIYDFALNELIQVKDEGSMHYAWTCFEKMSWAADDSFYCYNPRLGTGGIPPGLVLVNAADGSASPLVIQGRPSYQLVGAPRSGDDGSLYFLHGVSDETFQQGKPFPPLSLVRTGADGVTNRVQLRPEAFRFREVFWTPDHEGVVILQLDEKGVPSELLLLPVDPSLPVVTLLPDARSLRSTLRWGSK